MTSALDLEQLMRALSLVSLLCGFLGALLYSLGGALARVLIAMIARRGAFRRACAEPAALRAAAARYHRQHGRVDPVLLAVVLVVVAVLGACSAPVPFHADSSVWYDDVKKGW